MSTVTIVESLSTEYQIARYYLTTHEVSRERTRKYFFHIQSPHNRPSTQSPTRILSALRIIQVLSAMTMIVGLACIGTLSCTTVIAMTLTGGGIFVLITRHLHDRVQPPLVTNDTTPTQAAITVQNTGVPLEEDIGHCVATFTGITEEERARMLHVLTVPVIPEVSIEVPGVKYYKYESVDVKSLFAALQHIHRENNIARLLECMENLHAERLFIKDRLLMLQGLLTLRIHAAGDAWIQIIQRGRSFRDLYTGPSLLLVLNAFHEQQRLTRHLLRPRQDDQRLQCLQQFHAFLEDNMSWQFVSEHLQTIDITDRCARLCANITKAQACIATRGIMDVRQKMMVLSILRDINTQSPLEVLDVLWPYIPEDMPYQGIRDVIRTLYDVPNQDIPAILRAFNTYMQSTDLATRDGIPLWRLLFFFVIDRQIAPEIVTCLCRCMTPQVTQHWMQKILSERPELATPEWSADHPHCSITVERIGNAVQYRISE